MINVVIIGSGNVARHLVSAFVESTDIDVIQLYARDQNNVADFKYSIDITENLAELKSADVYIIAVSDSAIKSVSQYFPLTDKLVVHTSGSVPIDALDSRNRKGVFYPLQTFSKNRTVDFKKIPICIESDRAEDMELLKRLANSISDSVYSISSEQRKSLHIAAVFVSNFTNHMYKIGNDICNEHHIPFDILKPLILETAEKMMDLDPDAAQTGPAIRYDNITIDSHLSSLTDDNQRNIYKTLTQSIQSHGKKL